MRSLCHCHQTFSPYYCFRDAIFGLGRPSLLLEYMRQEAEYNSLISIMLRSGDMVACARLINGLIK